MTASQLSGSRSLHIETIFRSNAWDHTETRSEAEIPFTSAASACSPCRVSVRAGERDAILQSKGAGRPSRAEFLDMQNFRGHRDRAAVDSIEIPKVPSHSALIVDLQTPHTKRIRGLPRSSCSHRGRRA